MVKNYLLPIQEQCLALCLNLNKVSDCLTRSGNLFYMYVYGAKYLKECIPYMVVLIEGKLSIAWLAP